MVEAKIPVCPSCRKMALRIEVDDKGSLPEISATPRFRKGWACPSSPYECVHGSEPVEPEWVSLVGKGLS